MIFQDLFSLMNLRFRIFDVFEEFFLIYGIGEIRVECEELIYKVFEMVKIILFEDYVGRFLYMFFGGQRQCVVIVCVLILNLIFIVVDELVLMFDVLICVEVFEFMKEFKEKIGVIYFYIMYDMLIVRYFVDWMVVMYFGRIVEMGLVEKVIDNLFYLYIRVLLVVVFELKLERRNVIKELLIKGEVLSVVNILLGCCFYLRCIYVQKGFCDVKQLQFIEYEYNCFVECYFVGKY